jgi:P4 family phage/plasmid primase-like protien
VESMEFDPVTFYSKYVDKITCAFKENIWLDKAGTERCNAKRTEEREKYLFKGLTPNHVLIECPLDILAMEFETHNNKSKEDHKEVDKDKVREWITRTAKKVQEKGFDYCICDHGGTSPWIYLCNITDLVEGYEKECKEKIAKLVVPEESWDFIDKTNFGQTLVPIIERPHWKFNKYKGAIHKIIDGKNPSEHKNICSELITKEVLDENKPGKWNMADYSKFDPDCNINSLNITSIVDIGGLKKRSHEYQGSNPWHGSSGGTNFTLDPGKNVCHCFRCHVGINAAQAIALNEGIVSTCDQKMTKDEFSQVLKIAQEKYGLKKFVPEYGECNIKILEPQKEGLDIRALYGRVFNVLVDDDDGAKKPKITEIIASAIENSYYIYTIKEDISSEMWIYKDGIFVPNARSEVKAICRAILKESYNMSYFNEVISKIEADTFIEHKNFFTTSYVDLIPVQNGILNLSTKELMPFDPKKIFFNKLPVFYKPDATCPAIEKHLTEVLKSKDDKEVFYELIGYCLWKDYPVEKAVMMVGGGRNGKGKSIEMIKRFVGMENCTSVPLIIMTEDSFSLSNLFGKMVNLAGDLSPTALQKTGMFKQTTGRDMISAKRKFLTDITFTNYAKHIFACNDLPRVYDNSLGFWERWLLFEFPYTFVSEEEYKQLSEKDRAFKKIMDVSHIDKITTQEELNGLLIKALEGLHRILKNKGFSKSQGSEQVKQFWVRRADSFMAFCFDHLEEKYEGKISKNDLRKVYSEYCRHHKIKGLSDKAIIATLQELFGASEERVDNKHIWTGISFKEDSEYKKYDFPDWNETIHIERIKFDKKIF